MIYINGLIALARADRLLEKLTADKLALHPKE